jgi:DNA invertase Pin-like site-specific DNA recombinase
VTAIRIGYARCSTGKQDLEANRQILLELGVSAGGSDGQDVLPHPGHLRRVRGRPAADAHPRRCGDRAGQGRAPKLSKARQAHLLKLHAAGEHTVVELAELFEVSRPTVYRVLERAQAASSAA